MHIIELKDQSFEYTTPQTTNKLGVLRDYKVDNKCPIVSFD